MSMAGKTHSDEAKQKMSEAAKKRLAVHIPWLGKTHSEESKLKMSLAKRIENCPCAKCGVVKTDENTNRVKSGPQTGQFMCYCRTCFSAVGLQWGRDNRGLVNERTKNRRDLFRARLHILKAERPCYDCGTVYPPEACDFDHVIGEKKFNLSTGCRYSWDEVRIEIDKCQLVCATCHRLRTEARRKAKI